MRPSKPFARQWNDPWPQQGSLALYTMMRRIRSFEERVGEWFVRGLSAGSMHIADTGLGHLGANAIVGGGIPHVVGAGLACKLNLRLIAGG